VNQIIENFFLKILRFGKYRIYKKIVELKSKTIENLLVSSFSSSKSSLLLNSLISIDGNLFVLKYNQFFAQQVFQKSASNGFLWNLFAEYSKSL
jgi:hypothetical protein